MKNELTQGIKQMYEEAGQIGHTGMRRLLLDVQAALDTQAAEIAALKADYLRACQTIAAMHEAATGRTGEAPWLGVVEDVAALKAERDALRLEVAQERERCAQICDAEARRYDNAWDRTGYASNVAEDLADEIRGEQGAAMQAQGVQP